MPNGPEPFIFEAVTHTRTHIVQELMGLSDKQGLITRAYEKETAPEIHRLTSL